MKGRQENKRIRENEEKVKGGGRGVGDENKGKEIKEKK